MTTTSVPHQHSASATGSLWRSGPLAIAAALARWAPRPRATFARTAKTVA